jgi:nitroimidazol reductase NimA-like FMN-containing flavoprotein (pyridoxamine 5'-phosphate oxidase superfamily)
MTHWYNEADGKLYFHGASVGHKMDALRACDKVSFCVYDAGYRREGEWSLNIRSVVVFGRLRVVEDPAEAEHICRSLCRKFSDDPAYAEQEWALAGDRVVCLALTPEHITGKLVNES